MFKLLEVFSGEYTTESPIERIVVNALRDNKIEFKTQVEIGKYRADILVDNLIIECDGAEYHTMPNKERDLYLKNKGYIVKHYTGSDIYNNVFMVLKDVKLYLYTRSVYFNGREY